MIEIIDSDRYLPYERLGCFELDHTQQFCEYDTEFGEDNWQIGWLLGGVTYSWVGMTKIYEDAYCEYLSQHPHNLLWLINTASDVYVDDLADTEAVSDYMVRQAGYRYLHDIAIRNSLIRLGKVFRGPRLLQINDKIGWHSLSAILSPGRVPFHYANLIHSPQLTGQWHADSIEAFYQSNKYLLVCKTID